MIVLFDISFIIGLGWFFVKKRVVMGLLIFIVCICGMVEVVLFGF